MNSFLIRLAIFLGIFFLLDKSFLLLRNRMPEKELDKRLELVLTGKVDADIIILGSSKPARDVIASQISDSLKLKAYNLAYPGSNIDFQNYILKEFLKNNNKKPKLLVLGIDAPNNLLKKFGSRFRMDRLYPLVEYKNVRDTLVTRGEKDKYLSDYFIIHQLTTSSFDFATKTFDSQDTLYADGSMPISYQHQDFKKQFSNSSNTYDKALENPYSIYCFTNLLTQCDENNITVVLALTPNFGVFPYNFYNRIKELAPNKHIMAYDTLNEAYKDNRNFFDNGHLTKSGAQVFTNDLIKFIRDNNILNR